MHYDIYVTPNIPHPSVEVIVGFLNLNMNPGNTLSLKNMTHKWMVDSTKDCHDLDIKDFFFIQVNNEKLFSFRDLFLFFEHHNLWLC